MKLPLYACLIIYCGLLGCAGTSELEITFIEQPTGGKNVALLSCIFEGKLLEGTTPITVSIEWWSTDSAGNNEQLEQQETHAFESVSAEQVGTELNAPGGDVFEGYYWIRVEWDDPTGAQYYEESEQVLCYEGPNSQ
ncbi:hypothetical protein JXB22_07485 [candidate division WOR-3 bacterium]|nr:hypothetical protein [candidate division WOR-3 bacterium]